MGAIIILSAKAEQVKQMTQHEIKNALIVTAFDYPDAIQERMAQYKKRFPKYYAVNAEDYYDELQEQMENKPASYFPQAFFVEVLAMKNLASEVR